MSARRAAVKSMFICDKPTAGRGSRQKCNIYIYAVVCNIYIYVDPGVSKVVRGRGPGGAPSSVSLPCGSIDGWGRESGNDTQILSVET